MGACVKCCPGVGRRRQRRLERRGEGAGTGGGRTGEGRAERFERRGAEGRAERRGLFRCSAWHSHLVEEEGDIGLGELEAALRERRVQLERQRRVTQLQRRVRILEHGAPRAALGHRLEELRADGARARRAEAVEMHLCEVVQRERVPLVRRQREVV